MCNIYVPTNHLYIGDIFLVNSKDIIYPNLSVQEGIGIILTLDSSPFFWVCFKICFDPITLCCPTFSWGEILLNFTMYLYLLYIPPWCCCWFVEN